MMFLCPSPPSSAVICQSCVYAILQPTLKGKGKEEMSQQMYCVWECRPAPLWKLIWISEDNEPDE